MTENEQAVFEAWRLTMEAGHVAIARANLLMENGWSMTSSDVQRLLNISSALYNAADAVNRELWAERAV